MIALAARRQWSAGKHRSWPLAGVDVDLTGGDARNAAAQAGGELIP
jgi:hypothetical protein